MTTVVISHAVGNMDTWLKGGEERKALFSKYCSSYKILRQEGTNRVSIVCENVDLGKMEAAMGAPEIAKAKAAHTSSTRLKSTSRSPAANERLTVSPLAGFTPGSPRP